MEHGHPSLPVEVLDGKATRDSCCSLRADKAVD